MTFENGAARLAERLHRGGMGFLTLRREELRETFRVERLTQNQSDEIVAALHNEGIYTWPHPWIQTATIRLYDIHHVVGRMARTVAFPDEYPETALREIGDILNYYRQKLEVRSDDVPWLQAFDLMLTSLLGREDEAWEDQKLDRPPVLLAAELAAVLGLSPALVESEAMIQLASVLHTYRPVRRPRIDLESLAGPAGVDLAQTARAAIDAADSRRREEHQQLLKQAAHLALGSREIPTRHVEVGLLSLRYRVERKGR